MYRVIKAFTDLQDKKYAYSAGDIFPREGVSVSAERLEELSSDKNKRGIPLIEEVKEDKAPEEVAKEPETAENEEFMNKPVETSEEAKEEPVEAVEELKADAPKKRGRKKNASNTD